MKNPSIVIISIFLMLFSIVSLNSCKESCEDNCENGYCITGECDCLLGWKGEACDIVDSTYTPNNTQGYVTFYQTADIDCGFLIVSVSQDSQIISTDGTKTFFLDGVEYCRTTGCANFTLEIGSYAYRASDTCGTVWADSLKVGSKTCERIILF